MSFFYCAYCGWPTVNHAMVENQCGKCYFKNAKLIRYDKGTGESLVFICAECDMESLPGDYLCSKCRAKP